MRKSSPAIYDKIKKHYTDSFYAYRDSVISGRRCAGLCEKQKIARQDRELAEGVQGYVFDFEIGLRPLLWIALNLRFPLGERIGKPMKLEGWQAYDIIVLFGWVKEDNRKERRFTDAYIEIARKNGKSTYAAALLNYLAFGEIQGARCYIGATSLDQAEETLIRAGQSLKFAKGKAVKVANSKNNKQVDYKTGLIKAIAAEPKDGKLAYGAIIDEYHQHKSNALIESIHSGNVSDQTSLLIRITTAGVDLNGVCHEEYEKCKRVLAAENDIARYFVSIYELDEGDDPADPAVWEKANPNMGVSVNQELLRANFEYSRSSETDFTSFKTKNLNMWCSGHSKWANMPVWLDKCRWGYDEEKLEGAVCYGGLDLSAVSDFTALTLDFPVKIETSEGFAIKHVQKSHFWIPSAQKDEIQRACRIPLDNWIKEGYVTAIPGEVIDYNWVADYISDAYERYQMLYIAVDKWNINSLVTDMPDWFREIAYEFSQGLKTMSPTIKDFERAYLTGEVTALKNPVIDWMMGCSDVYQDSTGNVKLVKPKRRTSARIDGIITSIMSYSAAVTHDISAADIDINDVISFF